MQQSNGALIVLEGLDGAGKSTQLEAVAARLCSETGRRVLPLHFPTPHMITGDAVRAYLYGSFMVGASPYAVASLFALDRYADYVQYWKADYMGGDIILCDRYTTANFVYQAARVGKEAREGFIEWVKAYEYGVLDLPKPDAVVWLDMPSDESGRLMKRRGIKKDKYESDPYYRYACEQVAKDVIEREGWQVVQCVDEYGSTRQQDAITYDIVRAINHVFERKE